MFTEEVQLGIAVAGFVIALFGWFWLVVRAFRVGRWWGIATLIPFTSIVFVLVHFRRAAAPVALSLIGTAITAAPSLMNLGGITVDLGPRNKIVDGERHLTITGWDQTDYGVLAQFPDTVVLQMANANVTDATLEQLRSMKQLRELDLNDSQVTDAGVAVLAGFPELRVLKLARTKVTADGVTEKLPAFPKLIELDLRGLSVPTKKLREWKNADPMNRKYAN